MLVIAAGLVAGPLLSAALVLVWMSMSRTPWREIGYVRPRSWIGGLALGIGLGVALKLVMKAIVMPLAGADPINQAYHFLVGNQAAAVALAFEVIVEAGFAEETVFRGYLFERFGKLLGHSPRAKIATVLATSLLFGSAHYLEQGVAGVQQAIIVGLVFGTIFATTGRIWMLMCAHAAFDLTAIAIIYWDLETAVGRSFFE